MGAPICLIKTELNGFTEDLSNQRTVKLEKHYSITKEYCLGGSFFTSSENDALSVPDLFQSVAESLVGDDTEGRQVRFPEFIFDYVFV